MFENVENKEGFKEFMMMLKDDVVTQTINGIGTELEADDKVVLSLFPLVCNTPFIFDLFKKIITNTYCGDSSQIEGIIDDLKEKAVTNAESSNLIW